MKELLEQPGFLAPSGTFGADLSYLLAVVFTVMFLIAWVLAKKGLGTQHHNLIFLSMVSMLIYFIGYYYARQLGVLTLEGKEGFGGPQDIYDNIFIPTLTTHLILVCLGLILSIYMIFQGFRACDKIEGNYILQRRELIADPKIFKSTMIIIGGIWAGNQLVITFIRDKSFAASLAWAIIFGIIALVVYLEKFIEKSIPDGARRHKLLGRATMIIFSLILVTSTLVYLMLYVIYPKI
ncbi:MAG: DUF420 domain-containing protein [Nitrospina sp.]|jgi:uncharacterized membrane protein YozB (DUF420 family)|nr:DUF420 domain-containing protein [Nitrospina sp.]